MFKAVLFDMDGVIIDSEPIHYKLEREFFGELGIRVGDLEHSSYVGATSRYMWSKIIQKHNLDYPLEELIEKERKNYIDYLTSQENVEPMRGVIKFIKELYGNGIKLALASSASRKTIEIVLDKFKLYRYIQTTISGDDIDNGKPAPDIFLYAAGMLGVRAYECLVIEDSKNGVQAAKAAGMKCVGYKNVSFSDQDLSCADMVIKSFNEISYDKLLSIT